MRIVRGLTGAYTARNVSAIGPVVAARLPTQDNRCKVVAAETPTMSTETGLRRSQKGEPVWELAELHSPQGAWSEDEYLALRANRLIEFTDGFVEVLPTPTTSHQQIVMRLFQLLFAFTQSSQPATVLFAPLRLRVAENTYREPDTLLVLDEHSHFIGEDFWTGADLVAEVLSPGTSNRERDLVDKRRLYAAAGVPEYWIVDPADELIRVLVLDGDSYREHCVARRGESARSVLLVGFSAAVDAVLVQSAR